MRSVIRTSVVAFAALLLGLFVFAGQSVQAATLTVSNTADEGDGSLRQAILDATTNNEANVVSINIPLTDPGYNAVTDRFTISLVSSLPAIPVAPFTLNNITGRGVTIKGNDSFRIFTFVNSAVVNFNNLTISNGKSSGGLGGGIYMGDSATLFLTNCVVSNNSATNGGGGIWVNDSGTLHVLNSTISNNTTDFNGGGGISISISGTLNITGSTVSGNHATGGNGGGIYNGVSGTVNATNSTVNGNTAGNLGGGICNFATVNVSSSTLSGNTATNGGGGIYNDFTATLNNSLVALNTAPSGTDLLGGGAVARPLMTVRSAKNVPQKNGGTPSGAAFTGNYNLIGNADGSSGFGPTTNQLGSSASLIDPKLGPLQNNGGSTFTQELLAGSPAIDRGTTALATDQRGISRPQDGDGTGGALPDVGSFELVRPLSGTPFDFTGDGKADFSLFTASSNNWTIQDSNSLATPPTFTNWGTQEDILVPADYNGDLKADIAVYRPSEGNWYILNSSGAQSVTIINWGGEKGDLPVPGDYNADNKDDAAIFRPSEGNWYVNLSGGGSSVVGWGEATDVLVPGDYDGDGRNDYAIYRPSEGNWYIRTNPATGPAAAILRNWGAGASDRPVPADYDGDGKTDIAVYRASEFSFYIINSATDTVTVKSWGTGGDVLVPADYDGDGKADVAVYRPAGGQWWILRSATNTVFDDGTPGVPPMSGEVPDQAVPSTYITSPMIIDARPAKGQTKSRR